ncbi:MAG: SHOCT domain-containing protein [Actinomycetota bacterium]|nr:SHOCT domain-containing protein [Actinomycetota bacterium]
MSMMWYWGGGVHWWGWLLGALAMVAFWGVLIWAVWYFVTAVTRRPEGHRPQGDRLEGDRPGAADPKRILDERLARGDIDADEYRRLRDLLQERDHSTPGDGGRPASTADRSR